MCIILLPPLQPPIAPASPLAAYSTPPETAGELPASRSLARREGGVGGGGSQHGGGGTGRGRERLREAANGKAGSEVARWTGRGEGNWAGRGGGATAGSGSGARAPDGAAAESGSQAQARVSRALSSQCQCRRGTPSAQELLESQKPQTPSSRNQRPRLAAGSPAPPTAERAHLRGPPLKSPSLRVVVGGACRGPSIPREINAALM